MEKTENRGSTYCLLNEFRIGSNIKCIVSEFFRKAPEDSSLEAGCSVNNGIDVPDQKTFLDINNGNLSTFRYN